MRSGYRPILFALAGAVLTALGTDAQPAIHWMRASDGIPAGERPQPLLAAGDVVLGADQAGGRFFRTLDHGMHWEEVSAPSFQPYLDAWIVTSGGDYLASHGYSQPDVYRSGDGGATWAPLGVLGDPPEGDRPVSLLETQGTTLLAGTYYAGGLSTLGQIYRSTDGGDTWTLTDTPGFRGAVGEIVQAPDGALYAAHSGAFEGGASGITRSLDDGATWTPVFQGIDEVEVVEGLTALPDGMLLASGYGRLLRSTDGVTWELLPGDLPAVRTLLAVGGLALGFTPYTTGGIFASADGGATWVAVDDGLDGRFVYDLTRDATSYLYAATDDGVYCSVEPVVTASEPQPVAEGALVLDPVSPNPVRTTAVIGYALRRPAEVELVVLDVLGRHVATLPAGARAAGRHRVEWNARAYPPGTYLVRIRTEHGVAVKRVSVVR